ncbi:MAG: SUMF1/EgtB/PvdO family nonheme iron enzyme [Acidobacteria bacterium]|nr:SUMF1/EgtB/PvdO family nonheme iron enzyme [Acidobacteriota bacterium]
MIATEEKTRISSGNLHSSEDETRLSHADMRLGNSTNPDATATYNTKEMEPGQVLGNRYEIKECIGSGGMGAIYTARRIHIGDTVAVKVLRPEVVHDSQSRERFQREARAAAKLHHPNAVVVHDFGQDPDGTTYIVMEYLEGRSLRDVMAEEKTIALPQAVSIMKQACAAIEAAHRLGIIHRDIKPDNIIILDSHDDTPHVKILDFGIAKLLDRTNDTGEIDPTLTQVGTVIGTPNYMSPEQCQGESLDARSDVYSLGVVLYEMLTGVQPFTAKNSTGVVIKHVTEKPRRLVSLNPYVPAEVERVVLKALEKKPEARQQSALDLAREFEAAVNQPSQPKSFAPVAQIVETKVDTKVVAPVPQASKSSRVPLFAVVGIALVLLLAGAAGWYFLFGKPSAKPQPSAKDVLTQLPPQKVEPEPTPAASASPSTTPPGMVLINGGDFKMGRDDGADMDQPSHNASVKQFFLDKTEVTNQAYKKFLDETKYPSPPSWKDSFPTGLEDHPVTDVTWEDANAYASWAGKRLPTEEEWEFAARGTDERLYPWGETYKPGVANINDLSSLDSTEVKTKPVGLYTEGASIFGLLDMSGNVWEWTSSTLKPYPGGKLTPDAESFLSAKVNLKVIRGGAWMSEPKQATVTYRRGWPAGRKDWPEGIDAKRIDYSAIGFRCAKDVPQP